VTADPLGPESTFFEVVLNQRACRQFDGRPVDDDVLARCLEAATHAPSAENKQPWVFVVVRDPDTRHQIVEMTRTAWNEGARSFSESRLTPALLSDVDRGVESGLASAPVIVVVCGDRSIGLEAVLPSSVFPATQNLLLAANAEGLGSALTTLATLRATELAELLELPDTVRPMAVVPLGWPARRLGPPRRLPLAERVHVDRFGRPWAT
jgi:nitroreductase